MTTGLAPEVGNFAPHPQAAKVSLQELLDRSVQLGDLKNPGIGIQVEGIKGI